MQIFSKYRLNLKKQAFFVAIFVVIMTASVLFVPRVYAQDEDFFSYERFYLNPNLAMGISGGGKVREDLNKFIYNYTEGIYALSSGNLTKAEKHLKEARKIWPEYFGTDFLIALIYEDLGDYTTAVRYYKSYLIKLKKYHSGQYRITGPFMSSLNVYGIEEYGLAAALIRERTTKMGVDIDDVRQVPDQSEFMKPLLIAIVLGACYVVFKFFLVPFYKKRKRVLDAPEGFWACGNCGFYNPDLRKECEQCGRAKKG